MDAESFSTTGPVGPVYRCVHKPLEFGPIQVIEDEVHELFSPHQPQGPRRRTDLVIVPDLVPTDAGSAKNQWYSFTRVDQRAGAGRRMIRSNNDEQLRLGGQ